ncbi:MAG: hypothetical protein M5R42_01930 [Rhodocyclaceae bacterium]|nr:hypothetical protein [Rhodocyclaceae bacterium]
METTTTVRNYRSIWFAPSLFDGTEVVIGRSAPADAYGIRQDFVRGLSDDSRYNHFMGQLRSWRRAPAQSLHRDRL